MLIGRVGKLSIRIPWKSLGWDPIVIILEDVFVCASQRDDEEVTEFALLFRNPKPRLTVVSLSFFSIEVKIVYCEVPYVENIKGNRVPFFFW